MKLSKKNIKFQLSNQPNDVKFLNKQWLNISIQKINRQHSKFYY